MAFLSPLVEVVSVSLRVNEQGVLVRVYDRAGMVVGETILSKQDFLARADEVFQELFPPPAAPEPAAPEPGVEIPVLEVAPPPPPATDKS